jgi:S-adenosylmethionine-diacylglycerol 3-amino-3-carboxypropyl transferase
MRSPLQFAVQREDPRLEERLLDSLGKAPKRLFAITAAGDTLLQLSAREDLTELVGADVDARQTAWARFKLAAAATLNRKDFCRALGVSQIDAGVREQLIGKVLGALPADDRAFLKSERAFFSNGAFDDGTFERVFACWRSFVERFVAPEEHIQAFFDGAGDVREEMLKSELWPISFELFFHQSLLQALFGPDAIQHAPPGSFSRYFRARFEWAFKQADAGANPYFSHVLRGRYGALDGTAAVPDFLQAGRFEKLAKSVGKVSCNTGRVSEVLAAKPGPYQLIQLSNILDWLSEQESEALAQPVLDNLAPGGLLLVRQLNNVRPLPTVWMRQLDFDPGLERSLHAADRSFFYSAVRIGRKK